MKHRNLRIAWSIWWTVVALLLVTLWVKSYWNFNEVVKRGPDDMTTTLGSSDGVLYFDRFQPAKYSAEYPPTVAPKRWEHISRGANSRPEKFEWYFALNAVTIAVPTWLPVIACIALTGVPWLPFRFSLRTLLIATTLIALVLGIIVYVSRVG